MSKSDIRNLDFGLLLILRELIYQRRTTDVARSLGLSQSAVSHALSRLRGLTGDQLFIRRPDGLIPTDFALSLLPHVEELISGGQQLLGVRTDFEPLSSERRIRIAAHDFIASVLSPPLRYILKHEAPLMRFTLQFAVGFDAIESLRQDNVDLALGRFSDLPEDCQGRWMADEKYLLVATPEHPALEPDLDIEQYSKLDHVIVSFRGGFRGTVDNALDRHGMRRRVVASVPTFLTALAMTAESDLVATVPARLAVLHASKFGLVSRELPFDMPAFETMLVRHQRASGDAGLDWLSERVCEIWQNTSSEPD